MLSLLRAPRADRRRGLLPITTAIAAEYAKAVRGEVDRYKDWVEHVG